MRTLFLIFIVAALLGAMPVPKLIAYADENALPELKAEITIAVRVDARPFVWRDNNTDQYLGFFWDICTEAVHRAGYRFRSVEVDSKKRKSFLNNGTERYDLLCEPTTITLKRMKDFADKNIGTYHLTFSPILFVANGTYVQRIHSAGRPRTWGTLPNDAPDLVSCKNVFDWLSREEWLMNTSENPPSWKSRDTQEYHQDTGQGKQPKDNKVGRESWAAKMKSALAFTLRSPSRGDTADAPRTYQIWGYVAGSTIGETIESNLPSPMHLNGNVICTQVYDSYNLAAADFCAGRLDRYFGDADIVRAALDERRRFGETCPADPTPAVAGTYEPYAFVVSSRNDSQFPERLTLALYGMFEDGTIERLFSGHFPDTQKSEYLNTLFRINSVPAGTRSTHYRQ